jgi:probable rRNA maturation factor
MTSGNRRTDAALRVVVVETTGRTPAAAGLTRWLRRVAPARARGTVTVALLSDDHVRALNRRYRGIDRVTDVLSFAMVPAGGGPKAPARRSGGGGRPGGLRVAGAPASSEVPGAVWLGDIAIAVGAARRQARHAAHSLRTELRVLTLHGLLHLLGHDHARDGGRMGRLEQRLRRRGGLPAGLIERTS